MSPTDFSVLSKEQPPTPHSSSFRDPSGFIFSQNQTIYRQINQSYLEHYDLLVQSGLYADLVAKNWLIAHEETTVSVLSEEGVKVIQPAFVPFISHPYEWSYTQLKDAALLTLEIAVRSLAFNMVLKDATPFNVQFVKGTPLFIDTLSFETYTEGEPWVAYRQFCETFLVPLTLMSYGNEWAQNLSALHIHGLSVKSASRQLPLRSYVNSGVLMHIHLQAKFQGNIQAEKKSTKRKLPKHQFLAMLMHLQKTIKNLSATVDKGVWGSYYQTGVLDQEYVVEKSAIVSKFIGERPTSRTAIDLGSNSGHFSVLLAQKGMNVLAVDSEHSCIDELYRYCKASEINTILPLIIDLTNPTPSIGWMNTERSSFIERCHADLIVALAVIHHLVIGRNVPFQKVAQLCAQLGRELIIEFIPKTDPKVKILLTHRVDVFEHYTQHHFEEAFTRYFTLTKQEIIEGTDRVLYLFHRK